MLAAENPAGSRVGVLEVLRKALAAWLENLENVRRAVHQASMTCLSVPRVRSEPAANDLAVKARLLESPERRWT